MAWVTAALSFLGGPLGAGIPALVALRRLRQDVRGEWRQRLDQAIALITADVAEKAEDRRRALGRPVRL